MSADRLRAAAARAREVAEGATPGPWLKVEEHGRDCTDEDWSEIRVSRYPFAGSKATEALALTAAMGWEGSDEAQENAAHIALWSPPVALAVADWLDKEAEGIESGNWRPCADPALAVADALLGSET